MTGVEKLVPKFKEAVGEGNLLLNPSQTEAYSIDGLCPQAVLFPGTPEEVSKILALANQEKVGVLPRGNGTKTGAGAIPKRSEVVLSTLRLNRVTDADCDNLTFSAQGGMTLHEAQKMLAASGKGYFVPMDPPFTEKATLGGIVATNSSGPRRFLYGSARDLIIGMKSVFPNGDIVSTGGKTVKNVSGFDLSKLMIGSMGTLGILVEITFRLLPTPEKEASLLIQFDQIERAYELVHTLLKSQLLPAAVEVLNGAAFRRIQAPSSSPWTGNYLVAVGLEGIAETIDREITEIGDLGKKQGALAVSTLNLGEHRAFWLARRDLQQNLAGTSTHLIALRSNFLISKWAEILSYSEKTARESGVECALAGHAGNGILESYLLVGNEFPSKAQALLELIDKLTSEAVKNEGNLVVESAPVPVKEKVDVWGRTRSDVRIVRSLKNEIDPAGILNPGRFVGGI